MKRKRVANSKNRKTHDDGDASKPPTPSRSKYDQVMKLKNPKRIIGICWVTCMKLMNPTVKDRTTKKLKTNSKKRTKMHDNFWLKQIGTPDEKSHKFKIQCTDNDGGTIILKKNDSSSYPKDSLQCYHISSPNYTANEIQLSRFAYLILHGFVTSKKNNKQIKELKYF